MKIVIKKWGNSAGMVIPGVVMRTLGLQPGQTMESEVKDNQWILTPGRKKYSLNELLAECDINAPAMTEEEAWGVANKPTGKELW